MFKKLYFVLFTLTITFSDCYSDIKIVNDNFTKFESITTKHGLCGDKVYSIIQDHEGFMWFGTNNGLARYDGFSFLNFYFNPKDSTSISSNTVTSIEIDKSGRLWIGTIDGLNLFNRRNYTFKRYKHQGSSLNSLYDNHIKYIYHDKSNNLWIETYQGVLHKYDYKKDSFIRYKHQKPSQHYYRYHSIYEDSQNKLWVGGRNLGPATFDRNSHIFYYYNTNPSNPRCKRDTDVACYFEDSNNNFWISATDGVYTLNRSTDEFKKILHTSTYSIIEDRLGDLWFASGGGIFRKLNNTNIYINYTKDKNNSQSISNNHVYKAYEDKSGIIWFGTKNGLVKYNPYKYKFKHIRHIPGKNEGLSGDRISSIIQSENGDIWIGTEQNGVNRFNFDNEQFTHYSKYANSQRRLNSNRTSCLYEDYNGDIWIGLWAGVGFNKIEKNGDIKHYSILKNSKKADWYNDFIESDNGSFYCGFWGASGLMEFDRDKEKFSGLHFININRPKNAAITKVSTSGNFVFINTTNRIVFRFNSKDSSFESEMCNKRYPGYKKKPYFGEMNSFIEYGFSEIKDIITHKEKIIIATEKGLLFKKINDKKYTRINNHQLNIQKGSSISKIFSFHDIIIVTFNNKLIVVDAVKMKPIKKLSLPNTITDITVGGDTLYVLEKNEISLINKKNWSIKNFSLPKDKLTKYHCCINADINYLYLGSNNGIIKYDKARNEVVNNPKIEIITKQYSINTFLKNNNSLWIGTDEGLGLLKLDTKELKWYNQIDGDNSTLTNNSITSLSVDYKNDLWIGTEAGVTLKKHSSEKFIHLSDLGEYGLSSHLTSCLHKDSEGNIWVGTTNKGLNILSKNFNIKQYRGNSYDKSGYKGESVSCIYEDSQGNKWVGAKGLNLFIPGKSKVTNFSIPDGFPSENIMEILEDDNGYLWISTDKGICKFNKKTFKVENTYTEKDGLQDNKFNSAACKLKNGMLVFGGINGLSVISPSNIRVNTTVPDLAFTAFYKYNKKIKSEIKDGETINLHYNDKFFSIEFAALDYASPEDNKFKYKLIGLQNRWVELGNNRKISFTQLKPGKYTFHLKGSNNDDTWNNKGIKFNIKIVPPFWKTWWFILLCSILVLLSIFFYFTNRIKNINKEKRQLLIEQKLLRSQINPHFVFNSLTAIQGFIYKNDVKTIGIYISRFAKLMRMILHNSREEFIPMEKENEFLNNYMNLQQLRFPKRFSFKIVIDKNIDTENTLIPPMLSQPFIENSIEHGFKNLSEEGKIYIEYKKGEKNIEVIIEDNGIGINKSEKKVRDNEYKSVGTTITSERLEGLGKSNNYHHKYEVIDLSNINESINGTRIVFNMPFKERF